MDPKSSWVDRLPGAANVQLILGLGSAIFALLLASVIGAIAVGGGDDDLDSDNVATSDRARDDLGDVAADPTASTVAPEQAADGSQVEVPSAPGVAKPGAKVVPPTPVAERPAFAAKNPCISSSGNTKTGVTDKEIKFGVHAPVTFDGQPLNLAEDPLEGVDIFIKYINEREGGINGRKVVYKVEDDRYNTTGAQGAADRLTDYKPFMISGTLGVDQVAVVASEACKQKIPYMAAGGSESLFDSIGMFQIAASYDTHLIKLAEFLGKESKTAGSIYHRKTKVGVTQLDSPYIDPSVESFKKALSANGLELVVVTKIVKPTVQTEYNEEINDLRKAEIVVPAQDPISTSRMVAECKTKACQFVWAFSNFAHEGDTALQLMAGSWNGVKGLAGGCYYMPGPNHNPYDTSKCGAMKQAHERWVAINGEDDWRKDGSGGSAGYQIVHFWLKALRDSGTDVSREGFVARLLAYDGYNDLVSGPISFRTSRNLSHGAELMVPLQAGVDKYTQLTPGFVDKF